MDIDKNDGDDAPKKSAIELLLERVQAEKNNKRMASSISNDNDSSNNNGNNNNNNNSSISTAKTTASTSPNNASTTTTTTTTTAPISINSILNSNKRSKKSRDDLLAKTIPLNTVKCIIDRIKTKHTGIILYFYYYNYFYYF